MADDNDVPAGDVPTEGGPDAAPAETDAPEAPDAPAAPDGPPLDWRVSGSTIAPGARRLQVVLWSDGVPARTLLAVGDVDDEGRFRIEFAADDLQPGVVDFVVVVSDIDTGRQGPERIVLDAPRQLDLDEPLDAPPATLDYRALWATLTRVLLERGDVVGSDDGEGSLDDAVEGVLAQASDAAANAIAAKMEVDPTVVEALRVAAADRPAGLSLPIAYVLAAAGLSLDVEALQTDRTAVRSAVELAIAAGTVDAELLGAEDGSAPDHVVALVEALGSIHDLRRPIVAGGSPVIELLEIACDDVDDEDQATLALQLVLHGGPTDAFWAALEHDGWRNRVDRDALRTVFWLDTLTLSSSAMVAQLFGLDPPLTVERAVELSVDDWIGYVVQATDAAIPARFQTGGAATRRRAYATAVVVALRRAHAEAAARALVRRSAQIDPAPVPALASALRADADIDVLTVDGAGDPQIVVEQRALRRALLGDDADPLPRLAAIVEEERTPPPMVARMGRRAFDGTEDTYRRAAFANAALLTIFSDLRSAASAPRAEDRVDLPDWAEQFGAIDNTSCEHCSSVYSPAAYLVDLLRFVGDRGLEDELLADARRPDLESIRLNCTNTETPLPYIDLVNEILESAVLMVSGAADTPAVGQTTITDPAELRVHPEHLAAAAYDAVRTAVHPFSMPFDLWEASARAYLSMVGIDRAEVRSVLRGAGEDTAADQLGLFAADLAILDGSAAVEPDYAAPAYKRDANLLRTATGLTFDELDAVLGTDYVRHGDRRTPLLLDTEPETLGSPFGPTHARRIHRLLLLAHRLDVPIDRLDRALGVVDGIDASGALSTVAVGQLAALQRLRAALGLTLDQVADLFETDVRTVRDAGGRSVYDDWFGKPTPNRDAPPDVFRLTADRSALADADAIVADNDVELRTALGLGVEDFAALQGEVAPELTLATMADLLRWTMLSRALGWSIRDVVTARRFSGVAPFARDGRRLDIAQTERFVELARSLRAAGVSVEHAEAVLVSPAARARSVDAGPSTARLAASLVGPLGSADLESDAARLEVLVEAVATELTLDPETARLLLGAVAPDVDGRPRAVADTLLDPAVDPASSAALVAADRLQVAAELVRALALPASATALLFGADTPWLDPNTLPLSVADLSTELERPTVELTAPPVVRAAEDGTCSIPLSLVVDGHAPDPGTVEWLVEGDVAAAADEPAGVARTDEGWTVTVGRPGSCTVVATVAAEPGMAPGVGAAQVNVRAAGDWPVRTGEGILALYTFHEGESATVTDVSGVGDPLDLTIEGDTRWHATGGLTIEGETVISSAGAATKINEAVRRTGEITVEAWITPTEAQQTGPARIVTISDGAFDRNVTLGHEGRGAVGRFRTTKTGDNGLSPATTTLEPLGTEVVHLVYTRAADGGRLYLDGREVEHQPRVTGTTDVWDLDMRLALGGELGEIHGGGRNWHGTYHLVGIYERALSGEEVAVHAGAGPRPALASPIVTADAGAVVMLPWNAPSIEHVVAGSFTADLPDTVTLQWMLLSGPAPAGLDAPTTRSTTVTFPTTGDYVLGLRATDRRDPGSWATATVAVRIAADPAGVPERWARFAGVLEFSRAAYATHREVSGEEARVDADTEVVPALFALLAEAAAEAPTARLTREFMDRLGLALGIGTQVDTLLADRLLGVASYGELADGTALRGLAGAASLARRSGSAPRKLLAWADATIDEHGAGEIEAAVRSTFDRERWLELAADVRDALREQQRDALVTFLLARGGGSPAFGSRDELYGHYLIDVEMSSCQLTSRIKQAISSVQQFVQRTLLGIERNVELPVEAAEQWRWMKSYRFWEANRKIFLHPENWIEPELRSDKSPFFEALEQELAQGELDDTVAERAFADYLAALQSVSNLEIVGICQEHDGSAPTEPQVIHLIGRGRGEPKQYWHRTLTGGVAWSPWRAVDADIVGDHVTPVFHNRRLFVFWADFEEKRQQPPTSGAPAQRWVSCRLAYTELRNGRWTPQILSDGAGLYRPTDQRGADAALAEDVATGRLDFSAFSLDVVADPTSGDLAVEVSFRGDQDMLVWPGFELPASGTGLRPRPGGPARLRSNRPISSDRHIAFGFGSPTTTYLTAIATPDPTGASLVPALTEGRPTPLTYQVTGWSPLYPDPIFAVVNLLILPTVRPEVERWAADHRWPLVIGEYAGLVPRIHPTPPRTRGIRYTISGVAEADKDAAVRWLRARPLIAGVDVVVEPPPAPAMPVTLLQRLSPPWTAVASRRVDLGFERTPFVVQDKLAGFLVRPAPSSGARPPAAGLTLLSHPLVGDLRRALDRDGVQGLLAAPPGDPLRHQADSRPVGRDPSAYVTGYTPTVPTAELDFDLPDAYSAYNWELFFHVPLLIAKLLSRNQRFDEAQRWLHYIFDPTAASQRGPNRGEPWQIKPFRREAMIESAERLRLLLEAGGGTVGGHMEAVRAEVDYLLGEIHDHPFDPHVVARLRTSAYKKAVVMAYLDNLIAWADQLFSLDTLESINEAAQLYVMAADILGERPPQKKARAPFDMTRAELEQSVPATAITHLLDTVAAPSSATGIGRRSEAVEPPVITMELAFCIPANPRLLGAWDVVADRLYKVRHCQNIEGIERALALFAPPIDPGALVRAAAAGTFGAAALYGVQTRPPHQRFRVLHERARAAADAVRRFGATLTHALEQRDAATLAELLSSQEVAMQRGTRSLLRLQRQEAQHALAALEKARDSIAEVKDFVDNRADETDLEKTAFGLATTGAIITTASAVLSQISSAVRQIPDVKIGAAGLSSPVVVVEHGGGKVAEGLNSAATALETIGGTLTAASGLVANRAALERQKAVFAHEKRLAAIDLARIDRELDAARTAVAIADDNIATLEAQIENVARVDQHLRSRFTNRELWNWTVGRAAELHFQAYSVALDLARRAERALRIELGADVAFVSPANWNSLRKGLLAGEGLIVDLTRMEAGYLDGHRREYEVSMPVRVAELGGADALRRDGVVDVLIPEFALDRRMPGQYMRRIKSVAVTVHGRSGPIAVPAKVTLLRGSTRLRPEVGDGYRREGQDDPRFADDILATSIVCSGRPGDTGLFQRDYDDDRFLPFEGAGLADSHWRIDLFPETSPNLTEVVDVELTIDYTAREGGDALRAAAVAALR